MNDPKPPKPEPPKKDPSRRPSDTETNAYGPNPYPPDGKGTSPYWPPYLIDIFIEPRQFFSGQAALGRPFYLFIAVWLGGLSYYFYSIEQNLLAASRSTDFSDRVMALLETIITSWQNFWLQSIFSSALCGLLLWVIGAWWFRVRIQLSGDLHPNPKLAKVVYFYSLLVKSIPHCLLVLVWTVQYPSYEAAFEQSKLLAILLTAAFGFGELLTAYIGVKTLFTVSKSSAQVWFVAMPAAYYAVGLFMLISRLYNP